MRLYPLLRRALGSYGHGRARGKAAALIIGLGVAAPVMAEPVEILALGDSLTQGYGLPVDEGFVPQLEAWLTARGHEVRIVNGGVSGDTTRGGLSRVAWSLTDEIDAMIVTLGGNDLLRGLDPADSRANMRGILEEGQAAGVEMLVIGLTASSNYGIEYKEDFEAIYPELSEEFGTLFEPNFFAGLMEEGGDPSLSLQYMQADGIHPAAEGVARIVEAIGPRVEELIAQVEGTS